MRHAVNGFIRKMKSIETYENQIQAIWADQSLPQDALHSTDGQQIRVEFPGWLNKGAGPDFREVRVNIGENEYFGAVEVHLNSSGWYSHQHHLDPAYNAVVLHVVLYNDTDKAILREDGHSIPQLELASILRQHTALTKDEAKHHLQNYDQLPGRCGIIAQQGDVSSLKRLIARAAEQRIQNKTRLVLARWNEQEPEELLFQLIFKSLGFSAYAQSFEELAQLYPFQSLQPLLRQPQRSTRALVLSRWFGACGLLSKEHVKLEDPTLRKEFYLWQKEWSQLEDPPRVSSRLSQGSRPQNSPERRLIGMYHHLYRLAPEGLLKGWLSLLNELDNYVSSADLKKVTLEKAQTSFDTPEWEIWRDFLTISSPHQQHPVQLIGKDRQIIIWANAILPFFLAYARQEKDKALEKLLYQLFIVLPGEAPNRHTRFMEKRLLAKEIPGWKTSTLQMRQGLIQIHHDFCHNFYQGCQNCEFVQLSEL